jgi:hypothetical protein
MPQARPEIRAAKEPLTTDEFKRALEQGLGRAILCLKKHDPTPYKEIILETCLKDTRYDAQCEGSRVPYLMEAIDLCHDEDFFRDAILERFPATPNIALNDNPDVHLEDQFTDFLLEFAKRGSQKARDLLYESFVSNEENSDEFSFGRDDAIIELDGLTGLNFVLEHYGKIASKNRKFRLDDWYLNSFAKQFGEANLQQHVKKLSANNQDVHVLVRRSKFFAKKIVASQTRQKPAPPTYEAFQNAVQRRDPYRGGIGYWSKCATKIQIKRAARDLIQETEPELIRSYLYAFYKRKFPFSIKHLLRLVRHEHSDIRLHSVIALQRFQDSRVRALALELIEDQDLRYEAVGLFEQNYSLGDADKIVRVLLKIKNSEQLHGVGYCIRDVYEKNRIPEALEPLILEYEQNPCLLCRRYALELLHDLEILPDWVLEEAQFDAHDDTREKSQTWRIPKIL